MTLDEFRRNWSAGPATGKVATTVQQSSRPLTFLPPEELILVPRLVFREGFEPAMMERAPQTRKRGWTRSVVWGLVTLFAVLGMAAGLAKVFNVADSYVETYVYRGI